MVINNIVVDRLDDVTVITINRPRFRNAVDRSAACELAEAFRVFETDESMAVAILTGAGDTFCAGADLKAIAAGEANRVEETGDGPMGPTRMNLSKPVIAAVEGHAVAGGLEVIQSGETRDGAQTFAAGAGRHGKPSQG
jgi:enoyl-CoA hydratase